MELGILGPLTLTHEGERHSIASERHRTLLALLAISIGRPVPSHRLMEVLWAGRRMQDERNALQASIARLRKLLESLTGVRGDVLIRTMSNGYQLALPRDSIDAVRFTDLASAGTPLLSEDPGRAIPLLERALAQWSGPALFDVSDSVQCRIEAAHLEDRRLSVREDLIAAKLAVGADRAVVAELRQLSAQHPERERFSEQLMLALYREGRQVEALDVFHGARRRLASEVGLEPGHGLRRLYDAILVQDRHLDLNASMPGVG